MPFRFSTSTVYPVESVVEDRKKREAKKCRAKSKSVDSIFFRIPSMAAERGDRAPVCIRKAILVSRKEESALKSKEESSPEENPNGQEGSQTSCSLDLEAQERRLCTKESSRIESAGATDPLLPMGEDGSSRRFDRMLKVKKVVFGRKGTLQHRVFLRKDGWQDISPLHDIPLYGPDGLFNFVCTTPRGQWVQFEVAENEPCHPLRVKMRENLPSHYAQNLPWTYGFLPQTILSSAKATKEKGSHAVERSPIHVFDLSESHMRKTGDVYRVKPLMAFLAVDKGNVKSWHVLAIDSEDYRGMLIDGLEDLMVYFPRVLDQTASWLKNRNCLNAYDKEAAIAQGGIPMSSEALRRVVASSHAAWKEETLRTTRISLGNSKPLTPHEMQEMWKRHTAFESREQIPTSEAAFEASLVYEKAWEQVVAHEGQVSNKDQHMSTKQEKRSWKSWKGGMMNISQNEQTCRKLQDIFKGGRILKKSATESFTPIKFMVNRG